MHVYNACSNEIKAFILDFFLILGFSVDNLQWPGNHSVD